MKTQVNKWFRWGAAGAFGLMLTLNVMVGLEFEKDKVLPSLTLVELGNQANAQSESGDCQTGGLANKYCAYWDIEYETSTGFWPWSSAEIRISCTTGGDFKCDETT